MMRQCQCPVGDASLELGQEVSDGDRECDEPYSLELDLVFDALGELAGGPLHEQSEVHAAK